MTSHRATPDDAMPSSGLLSFYDRLRSRVLAAAVLSVALSPRLEPIAESYWSGSRHWRFALRDASRLAEGVLGEDLYRRLRGLLARRGVSPE